MSNPTDIKSIKAMALAFLNLPVEKTDYSPIVVLHPVFESGFVSAKINGKRTMVNILESEENLRIATQVWEDNIKRANDASQIFAFIRKSYRLTFLKYIKQYLSNKDFSILLADAWVSSENPNQDINVPLKTAISWFKKADKKSLMNEEDYEYYQSLPETITVYRGVAVGRNPQGLSWTCNKKTAEWFANRWSEVNGKGYVQVAEVKKSNVLAYFNTREEDELVVDTNNIVIKTL